MNSENDIQQAAKGNLIIMIFLLPFLGAGLYICSFSYKDTINGFFSNNWPQTEGVIITSDVKTNDGQVGKVRYLLDLSYSYEVDGSTYTGERFTAKQESWQFSREAKEITKRYPEGSEVTVYFKPQDPTQSVLQPGMKLSSLLTTLFGAVLVFVFSYIELLLLKGMFSWR